MDIDRDIVEALGADHRGQNSYTGDYEWGGTLYRSPSGCLEGILEMWLLDVPAGEKIGREMADELVAIYGDGSKLDEDHYDRIVEAMRDVQSE